MFYLLCFISCSLFPVFYAVCLDILTSIVYISRKYRLGDYCMKIKLPATLYQRILGILSFLFLMGQFICLILRWNHMPDEIPTHFGLNGRVDAYGTKGSVLLLPVISILIYLLILFVEKFPELWNVPGHVTPENMGWIYGNVKSMLASTKLGVCFIFFYINYCTVFSRNLGAWFMPVSLLYLSGSMAFFLWRAVHFK